MVVKNNDLQLTFAVLLFIVFLRPLSEMVFVFYKNNAKAAKTCLRHMTNIANTLIKKVQFT